jgi:hypothetical protein
MQPMFVALALFCFHFLVLSYRYFTWKGNLLSELYSTAYVSVPEKNYIKNWALSSYLQNHRKNGFVQTKCPSA